MRLPYRPKTFAFLPPPESPLRSPDGCSPYFLTADVRGSNRKLVSCHKFLLYSLGFEQRAMKSASDIPSLRQLHVFEAVARHKSIGRAAAAVNLSQPAATQAIAALESRFGVALFERGRSG